MARPRFKIKFDKSLIARLSAIAVLVGLGSFAIVQSYLKGANRTEDDAEPEVTQPTTDNGQQGTGLVNGATQFSNTQIPPVSPPGFNPSGAPQTRFNGVGSEKLVVRGNNDPGGSNPSVQQPPAQQPVRTGGSFPVQSTRQQPAALPNTKFGASSTENLGAPAIARPVIRSFSDAPKDPNQQTTPNADDRYTSPAAQTDQVNAAQNQQVQIRMPAGDPFGQRAPGSTTPYRPLPQQGDPSGLPSTDTQPSSRRPAAASSISSQQQVGGIQRPSTNQAQTPGVNNQAKAPGYSNTDANPPSTRFGQPSPAIQGIQPTTQQTNSIMGRTNGSGLHTQAPPAQVHLDRNQLQNPYNNSRTAQTGTGMLGGSRTPVTPVAMGGRAAAYATSATPGAKHLEGVQTPSLTIQKVAPTEIQVGKPSTFQIIVKNVGQVDAHDVLVMDRIPQGTQLDSVTPQADSITQNSIQWNLGTIQAGQESIVTMQLTPLQKGEIGSVARVSFQASASVRTICTKPQLSISHTVPAKTLIGDEIRMNIVVRNDGDGAASGVVIETDIPSQVAHPHGQELEYEVGTLGPGEVRELPLTLSAKEAGLVRTMLAVRDDMKILDSEPIEFEVISPQIKVAMSGPRRRFLERRATHFLHIENQGTAPATNVELVAHLPKGLKFVETNNHGSYDAQRHAVYWSLEQLPAGAPGSVKLVTLPVETGEQRIEAEVKADLNLSDVHHEAIVVEQLAELFFDIDDVADPIEIGSDTVYQVRVTNQGSKAATNVRVQITMPDGLQAISAEGPTQYQARGTAIFFEPITKLNPSGEALFKIQARGLRAGDHRIRVELTSDERSVPVAKEESTQVYADDR